LTLLAAICGSAVATIDGFIVNVALPAIERNLVGGLAGQQWVANAYLLSLGSLILLGGSLGDVWGERRVFTTGIAAFGAFSLACALAPTIGLLVAARALQGAAGALVTPSSLAIIVAAFPPAQRSRAVGSWTAWAGIALVAGPLAGGWIVDHASWRWIFALNVPLVVATLVLISVAVPGRSASAYRRPIDLVGACLCALALAGLVFGLVEESRYGWTSPAIVAPLAGGAAAFALFVGYERRVAQPMLKLGLFSRRNFAIANTETFAMYAGVAILFFFLVIYLQQVAGYGALKTGLTTLPETAVMFALSRRAGALADRFGPRLFMGAGPVIAAAGGLPPRPAGDGRLVSDRSPARTPGVRARPRPHGRAADGDRSRRRGRERRGYRVGGQQRGCTGCGASRRRGRRGCRRERARRQLIRREPALGARFPRGDADLRRPLRRQRRDRRDRHSQSAPRRRGGGLRRRPACRCTSGFATAAGVMENTAPATTARRDRGSGRELPFTARTPWPRRLDTPLRTFLRTETGGSGLMALFFFVVGLEARREFDLGELRERRRLLLPLLAGLGGIVVPVARGWPPKRPRPPRRRVLSAQCTISSSPTKTRSPRAI